jgi:hypothetical protein
MIAELASASIHHLHCVERIGAGGQYPPEVTYHHPAGNPEHGTAYRTVAIALPGVCHRLSSEEIPRKDANAQRSPGHAATLPRWNHGIGTATSVGSSLPKLKYLHPLQQQGQASTSEYPKAVTAQ